MNDKNKSNGEAYFNVNDKEFGRQKTVMWAFDPEKSPELSMRWRMMYEGNPDELPPPYDIKEWYKEFELYVIE